MIDDFITFFIAGQETTANALAFCFLELGKRPEIAIKAREEVDRVLGERTDMNYQDVNDLKYCSAIFKEALRLYPPAPLVTRQIKESITIKGIKIPSETQLFVSSFLLYSHINLYFFN
jgi:cholesterol 24(S)-hydroxylase